MDDGNVSVSNWVKFFKDAEIPDRLGENYAMIFCDHRIKKEILGDLTREILVDMGIKAMGDIIAILKQAKIVAEQVTRENTSKLLETKTTKATPSKSNSPKPSPASRMITNSINSKDFSKPAMPERKALEDAAAGKSVFSRLGQDVPSTDSCGVFKRLGDPVVSTTSELPYAGVLKNGGQDGTKKPAKKTIKLKTIRPTTPIKITTTTTRTKSQSLKRKSVLDRLGPATEPPKQAEPAVKRTMSSKDPKPKSVLQRLGKKVVGSSDEEESETKVAKPGPKIIRLAPSSRPKQLPAKATNQNLVQKAVAKAAIKRPSNVLTRLGNKVSSTSEQTKKPLTAKRPLAMDSTSTSTTVKKRILHRSQSQKPAILRLRVPLKRKAPTSTRPISSNHVSSTTSAGIFKGEAASSSSSVFSRLGAK